MENETKEVIINLVGTYIKSILALLLYFTWQAMHYVLCKFGIAQRTFPSKYA